MSYNDVRHFADSWGLVFMGASYLILIGWHFRPGGRRRSDSAALMIFEQESNATEADHG